MNARTKRKLRNNAQAYVFLSPFLILVSVLYIFPAILTIVMSFTDLDTAFIWNFVGMKNYLKIFKDPNTPTIIWTTVKYVLISITFTTLLQLFYSTMTTYAITDEKKGNFFKLLLMIPMITPGVVYSVLWIWLLDASSHGVLNQLYMNLTGNDPVNWIASYPFQVIVIAQVLTSVAYGTTVFSSAIKSIPETQFRAARIDGAGEGEIFLHIILPNLKPHISFIVLWETLGLLTSYVSILLITNGGPGIKTEIWALSAYHKAFGSREYGYGAAISVILILVVATLMALILFISALNEKRGIKNVE